MDIRNNNNDIKDIYSQAHLQKCNKVQYNENMNLIPIRYTHNTMMTLPENMKNKHECKTFHI